jgi:hypothetical protein
MTTPLKKTIQKQYFYFFSWGYFYSAGYFSLEKLNRLVFNENFNMNM